MGAAAGRVTADRLMPDLLMPETRGSTLPTVGEGTAFPVVTPAFAAYRRSSVA